MHPRLKKKLVCVLDTGRSKVIIFLFVIFTMANLDDSLVELTPVSNEKDNGGPDNGGPANVGPDNNMENNGNGENPTEEDGDDDPVKKYRIKDWL